MSEETPGRKSYKERILSRVSRYRPVDRADVVAFRKSVYGEHSFLATPECIRWTYEDSPEHGSGERSPLWLYRVDGEVKGQLGGIRTSLKVCDHEYPALWATDLFVSPELQGRGVGAALAEQVSLTAPVTAGVEVTEDARKAFARLGWSDLGEIPLYVRPFDVSGLAGARGIAVPGPIGRVGTALLRLVDIAAGLALRTARIRLVEVERFDERSDAIWAACAEDYRVIGRRDAAWLNWRYVDFPVDGFYQRFYLQRGSTAIGHAAIRTEVSGGVDAATLVDFLCPPRWIAALLSAFVALARRQGVAVAYCLKEQGRAAPALRVAGFIRRSTGWRWMVRAGDLPPDARAAVLDPESWFLTAGDSNVDYPRVGTNYGH